MSARYDVGDDPEQWKALRDKAAKERLAKKEEEESVGRDARCKTRREENEKFTFKPGLQVMVQDLASNKDKNGSIGELVEYIAAKGRWTVLFGNKTTNNFKIDNLVIQDVQPQIMEEDVGEIPTAKIYITNLSKDTNESHLIHLFGGIGALAKEPLKNAKGKSKGYADEWPFAVKLYKPGVEGGDACVEFIDKCSARAAIKTYNGHSLRGSTIQVAYAGGGGKKDEPRERSRSRERIQKMEKERLAALAAVSSRIKENEPISESKYFG